MENSWIKSFQAQELLAVKIRFLTLQSLFSVCSNLRVGTPFGEPGTQGSSPMGTDSPLPMIKLILTCDLLRPDCMPLQALETLCLEDTGRAANFASQLTSI